MTARNATRLWHLVNQIVLSLRIWMSSGMMVIAALPLCGFYLVILQVEPGIRPLMSLLPGIWYLIPLRGLMQFCNSRSVHVLPIREEALGRSLWWPIAGLPALTLIASTVTTMLVAHAFYRQPLEWTAIYSVALAIGFTGLPLCIPLSESPSRTLYAVRKFFSFARPLFGILYFTVVLSNSITTLKPAFDFLIFFNWLLAIPMTLAAAIGIIYLVNGYVSPYQLLKTTDAAQASDSFKSNAPSKSSRRSQVTAYINAVWKAWMNRTILLSLAGVLFLTGVHILLSAEPVASGWGLFWKTIPLLATLLVAQTQLIATWLLPLERHLPEFRLLPMSTKNLSLLYSLTGLSPNIAAILLVCLYAYVSDSFSLNDFYIVAHILIAAVRFPGYRIKIGNDNGMRMSALPVLAFCLVPFSIFQHYYVFWIELGIIWYVFYKWTNTLLREGQFARTPANQTLHNSDSPFATPIR